MRGRSACCELGALVDTYRTVFQSIQLSIVGVTAKRRRMLPTVVILLN